MWYKRMLQGFVLIAVVVACLGSVGSAGAWSCNTYITVQWGDTLSGIAAMCGTTVQAIRAANPGLGWWVYAGQLLYMPTGNSSVPVSQPTSGGTYIVKAGDTLAKIAARAGCSLSSILAVNPQIQNPSLIYAGQKINLPVGAKPPVNPPPPPPCNCTTPPSNDGSFSTLKITFKGGMYIRSAPNGKIIASAVKKETVYYFPSSRTVDTKGRVWVQVKLFTSVPGYSTGWLMVRDQFGTY